MTARVIRESYDGGSIEVEPYDRATRPYAHPSADGRIVLAVTERPEAVATLHLTRTEVLDAVMILLSAVHDLDHPQTAPEGAGAAPTGDCRGALPVGGRTETTGLGVPPAEPGRPNQAAPLRAGAAPTGETSPPALVDDPDGHTRTETGHGGPSAAVPGMAPIVVVNDENARAVAGILNCARTELLVDSTPVEPVSPSIAGGPETCEHGYTEGDCDQFGCDPRCAHGCADGDCPDTGCLFTHQSPATAGLLPPATDSPAPAERQLLADQAPVEPVERARSYAALSLVIPVALFGGMLLALAATSGKLRYLVEHLPLPEPGLNGWPLLVLTVGAIGLWRHLSKVRTSVHELDVLLYNQEPRPDPWFGTSPFTDVAPDPVPRRRSHPPVAAEDWHPDIAELNPTILPRGPRREQP